MKKYRCTEKFYVDSYDGNGFILNEDGVSVDKGSIWIDREEDYRFVGGQVRLDRANGEWLELSKETVDKNFKEIA